MSSEYIISNVADFLKVPLDRQADCLIEFADFLSTARDVMELVSIAGAMAGADVKSETKTFVWIDDGKKNITITMQAKGGA